MHRDRLVSVVAIVTSDVVAATALGLVATSVVVASGISTIITSTSWGIVISLLVIVRRRSRVAILILTTLVVVILAVVTGLIVALGVVLITIAATAWGRWRAARVAGTNCRRSPSTSTGLRRWDKRWIQMCREWVCSVVHA
jgi:hypothetical protein